MSYGVNVTNIYELLSEDGEAPVSKQQPKAPAKTTSAPAKQSSKPQTQTQKPQSSNNNQPARGGSSRPPQNRPPRQQKTQVAPASDVQQGEDKGAHRDAERRERKRGTYSTGGQRTFDRRSGTGRGRENKKGGAGRANWGTDTETPEGTGQEQSTEEKPATEEKTEEKKEETKEEEPEEEKDNTKTLEEFLAEREAKKPSLSLPQSRKINEGADPKELKKWEKYQVLKREFEEEEKEEEEEEEEEEATQKKSKKQTVPLNELFDVRTPPIRTGGRGRGRGRGGFRGDRPERGRGGSRGGRGGRGRGGDKPAAEINLDEQSFPTLKPKA